MNKIIFLDIDGVLIPDFKKWQEQSFNANCVDILLYIIRKTGAKIVISSSWRHHLWALKTQWLESWLDWDLIVWVTPSRTNEWRDWEIQQWIKWNLEHLTPINRVAIDDQYQSMSWTDLLWKLVIIEPKFWLTRKKAELAIFKLNN